MGWNGSTSDIKTSHFKVVVTTKICFFQQDEPENEPDMTLYSQEVLINQAVQALLLFIESLLLQLFLCRLLHLIYHYLFPSSTSCSLFRALGGL